MKKGEIVRKLRKALCRRSVTVALALIFIFSLSLGIGTTVAWLTDKTDPVTNTFTSSDINIKLTETTGENYKMVPGWTIAKDPKVTIKAGSEACWLFVRVEEDLGSWKDNTPAKKFTDYLKYTVISSTDKAWTRGNGSHIPENVYYLKVTSAMAIDTDYPILVDNKITVSGDITKEMMDEIDGVDQTGSTVSGEKTPTLTFKAAAVQYYKAQDIPFEVEEAYDKVRAALED